MAEGAARVCVYRGPPDSEVLLRRGRLVGPTGDAQKVELHATRLLHLGPCEAGQYPIAKAKLRWRSGLGRRRKWPGLEGDGERGGTECEEERRGTAC